ncbi:MAG: YceI family protein [Pseudomonadota bacterium]
MRPRYIALAAGLLIATPLIAHQAMQTPGAKDIARVSVGTYSVDPSHTLVAWEVDHLGFTPYIGLFGDSTGKLVIDPKNPNAATVDITIPVSKVTTANAGLTAHLLRAPKEAGGKADFFGPAPADARFVSTSVMVDSDGDEAKVTGNLTLNGVTKPVTLEVDFYGAGKMPAQMGGKEGLGFEAEGKIKRSDFGINAVIPMVSDEVKLKIAVGFFKD